MRTSFWEPRFRCAVTTFAIVAGVILPEVEAGGRSKIFVSELPYQVNKASLIEKIAQLVRGGIIKFEVFPELDGFVATATAEFPEGTPPEITTQAIQSIEAALLRLAEKTPTTSGKPLLERSRANCR